MHRLVHALLTRPTARPTAGHARRSGAGARRGAARETGRMIGLALAILAGPGLAVAGAQDPTPVQQARPPLTPFAMPWEVSLRHVHQAMTGLDFELDQTRRVLDLAQGVPQWIETRETCLHRAASA